MTRIGHEQPWTAQAHRGRWRSVRLVVVAGLVLAAGATLGSVASQVREPSSSVPVQRAPAAVSTPGPSQASSSAVVPTTAEPSPTPSVPAPPAVPARREVTADAPLRVWIAGDSMWEVAGPVLATRLEATGRAVAEVDVRYSSGLTRPDFLDWPGYATDRLAELVPEVVVFLVGANDSQPMAVDGRRLEPGTAAFRDAYLRRARTLMTLLAEDGRQVLWVGLPVMRPTDYDARMVELADLHERAAASIPRVSYVPTRALLSDADGQYADRLPTPGGTAEVIRSADGIHLSSSGAQRLAEHVFDHLAVDWAFG